VADRGGTGTGTRGGARAGKRAGRPAGWREVLIVATVAVGVVLGAAILTSVLPTDAQRVIFHTPVLIGVLVIGTGLVLWRIAARRPPEP
jgi:FtsH-binding integral membrane protein